jgi:hypothetical protein
MFLIWQVNSSLVYPLLLKTLQNQFVKIRLLIHKLKLVQYLNKYVVQRNFTFCKCYKFYILWYHAVDSTINIFLHKPCKDSSWNEIYLRYKIINGDITTCDEFYKIFLLNFSWYIFVFFMSISTSSRSAIFFFTKIANLSTWNFFKSESVS